MHCRLRNYYVEIEAQFYVLLMIIQQEYIMKNNNLIWQYHFIQSQLKYIVSINNQINRDYLIHYLNQHYVIKKLVDLMMQ